MAFKNIAVIFIGKKLTSKNGKTYFSGKTEGSEDFDIMAFLNESKDGRTKYLSVTQVTKDKNYKSRQTNKSEEFSDEQVDPDDLPF
jgi:hypothetical protein